MNAPGQRREISGQSSGRLIITAKQDDANDVFVIFVCKTLKRDRALIQRHVTMDFFWAQDAASQFPSHGHRRTP
jgi:hypothetical protein